MTKPQTPKVKQIRRYTVYRRGIKNGSFWQKFNFALELFNFAFVSPKSANFYSTYY